MVSTDEHEDACVHDSLCELNAKALKRYKANEPAEAVAAYSTLFTKVKTQNLTHAEIYTCYNNCAAALMQIGQFEKALQHAEHARKLAEEALHRQAAGPTSVNASCILSFVMLSMGYTG